MEKRQCCVPAADDGMSGIGRGSHGSTDAHQDWARMYPHVLDLAKEHLSKEEEHVFLRSAHLVNHHWSSWVVGAAKCLELEIEVGDCQQQLMGVVNRFTALESVTHARAPGLGDATLLPLQQLSQLRHLALVFNSHGPRAGESCASEITDVGLAHIGAMTTLVDLDLSSCRSISDRGVAELCHLTNLKRLSLLLCTNVTEASMVHLAVLHSLADLDMRYCNHYNGISDTGVGHLGNMSSLTKLAITSVYTISDDGVSVLCMMTGLVSLNVMRCSSLYFEFRVDLQSISNLTNLTELHLPPTSCTVLQSLGVLTALSALALRQRPEPGIDLLNVLKQWRHLSRFELHSPDRLFSYDCSIIGNLTDLAHLALSFVPWDGLTWLSNLLDLETLELRSVRREGCEPDSIVQSLRPLTRLRKLDLSGCPRMTGRFMCFLTCLVELNLRSNFFIGDDELREFTALIALTRLDLGRCKKVTDEGLISLGALSKLADLDLRETCVTDVGLRHLLPLRFLRHVLLDGCARLSHSFGRRSFGVWRRMMEEVV